MAECESCGAELARRTQKRFCSRRCVRAVLPGWVKPTSGSANPRYNGGLCRQKDGRLVIYCRDRKLLLFSRAVMEAELGRPLRSDEIVHHVNGDVADDRPENLQIVTRAEHCRMHRVDQLRGRGLHVG